MKEEKKYQIEDNEIRIIGEPASPQKHARKSRGWIVALGIVGIVAMVLIAWLIFIPQPSEEQEPSYFEPAVEVVVPEQSELQRLGREVDSLVQGFTEIRDTVINDIPLRIYIPHNATMSLHIGKMDKTDSTIIYTAQAADIRADNGKIVGAFVLKGEPRAWGLSKKGFCASIDGKVTVGVADNSPLFEEATEKGGYFFRQYPLVKDGELVENEPKNKSVRRAICDRRGEIFMAESGTAESFHDFAQALVDLGCDQATSLVGGSAYGWAINEDGSTHEFGDENYFTSRRLRMPRNTSYIVWKRK